MCCDIEDPADPAVGTAGQTLQRRHQAAVENTETVVELCSQLMHLMDSWNVDLTPLAHPASYRLRSACVPRLGAAELAGLL